MNQQNSRTELHQRLDEAIKPIVYGDIFDYPLTLDEIHRYLEFKTSREAVSRLLGYALEARKIIFIDGFYSLVGRSHLVAKRQERQAYARSLWPRAVRYGHWIASLPFVKMLAITGSLSVENPRNNVDDIDYLIVTRAKRLWLCRAMIIFLVRLARRRGVNLCPNYLLTENVLQFDEANLYTAREMVQMVPLFGRQPYLKMWAANAWVADFLPQGNDPNLDRIDDKLSLPLAILKRISELVLAGLVGDTLERLLQKIQISKHSRLAAEAGATEHVVFTADVCKGHYDAHGQKTLEAYQQRIRDQQLEKTYEYFS